MRVSPPTDSQTLNKAVLIVVDGVRLEECMGENTSDLSGEFPEDFFHQFHDNILPEGTLFRPAFQTGTTLTAPAHLQMTSGRASPYGQFPNDDAEALPYLADFPSLFQATDADGETPTGAIFANSTHLRTTGLTHYPHTSNDPDWVMVTGDDGQPAENDRLVISALLDVLQDDAPTISLANLHHADNIAHYSEDPQDYLDGVTEQDDQLHRTWQALQTRQTTMDQTLLVILGDHGRHREGDGTPWQTHGDSCAGCREIPIFFFGPGIAENQILNSAATLDDVAPTIAHLLGLELPYAEGMILEDALSDTTSITNRSGTTDLATAGSSMAWVEYAHESTMRSQVLVDDEIVSSNDAFEARGPVLVEMETGLLACWRELTVSDSGVPEGWAPTCSFRDPMGNWTDWWFPIPEGHPGFLPSLTQADGTIWLAYTNDPDGRATTEDRNPLSMRLARTTTDGQWEEADDFIASFFPNSPSLVSIDAQQALLAFAGSEAAANGREARSILVYEATWPENEGIALSAVAEFLPDHVLDDTGRLARPTLWSDGSEFKLAFLAIEDTTTTLFTTHSTDRLNWSTPSQAGLAAPHLSPVWGPTTENGESVLFWVQVEASSVAEACRQIGDKDAECVDLASSRVNSLAPGSTSDGLWLSLDTDIGQWQTVLIEFEPSTTTP